MEVEVEVNTKLDGKLRCVMARVILCKDIIKIIAATKSSRVSLELQIKLIGTTSYKKITFPILYLYLQSFTVP